MAMTVAQGVALMNRRLEALRGVHRAPIEAADSYIMSEVPVYTGAYKESVQVKYEAASSEIFVSLSSLIEAQAGKRVVQKIYDNVHKAPPEGPYPLRVEAYGAPVQRKGGGMWHIGKIIAQNVLTAEVLKIRSEG